jgi:hypothetical protein
VLNRQEQGQTLIEFAIICTVLLMLTVGLLGVGQGFYQYNALSAAARFGARWGAVVGGTCEGVGGSGNDWCTQLGAQSVGFWDQAGNIPVQSAGTSCPTDATQASSSNSYQASNYTASSYSSGSPTNIAGAIAQRFDSNSTSANSSSGMLTPGFNLSKLWICIQLPTITEGNTTVWDPAPGNPVQVFLYYQFTPIGGLLTNAKLKLVASSRYVIE